MATHSSLLAWRISWTEEPGGSQSQIQLKQLSTHTEEDGDFLAVQWIRIHLPVDKNPPSSAGDVGSIPRWGTKIPHATEQLSGHMKV